MSNEKNPASDCTDHDEAWKMHFVVPIAKAMKKRGVGYMCIIIRDDGKASFVLEPNDSMSIPGGEPGYAPRECSPYQDDDRGNVVDFYRRESNGELEKVARLDREGGKTADMLVWDNFSGDLGVRAWAEANGYADQLSRANDGGEVRT